MKANGTHKEVVTIHKIGHYDKYCGPEFLPQCDDWVTIILGLPPFLFLCMHGCMFSGFKYGTSKWAGWLLKKDRTTRVEINDLQLLIVHE